MPEPWPADAESAAAFLSVLVRQIDARTAEESKELLSVFMFAAWPRAEAQDQ
jgi:hypothetical protein